MGTVVVNDARLYVAEFNLSGDMNKIQVKGGQETKEDTAFGALIHTVKPGLMKTELSGAGFAQSGTTAVEDVIMAKLGGSAVPITVAAEGGDVGESCRFFKGVFDVYDPDMSIGELHKFNFSAKNSGSGNNPLVRGIIFEDGKTARTGAVNFPVITNLGPCAAGQKIYIVVHLLAFVGTDVTFHIMSAVTNFATTAERAVGSLTQMTAVGSQYIVPVNDTTTDTFWRGYCTTVGGFTSLNAVMAVGIL